MFKSVAFAYMLVASINATPTPTPLESATLAPRVAYKQFTGDGSKADGWPVLADWHTWESLFAVNSALMKTSCTNNGFSTTNDSPQEIANIGKAIQTVSKNNGVDPRFVLAVVMEESAGCVRVPTTVSPDGTVRNPGLLQDHNGTGTCANRVPCPASEITQMIKDGVHGTPSGDGLKQTVASTKETGAQGFYAGARKYNSGSVNLKDLSDAFGANPNYASDIANRLIGWTN